MDAMCPSCGGDGCRTCNQTGKVSVDFGSGLVYTRHCNSCGRDNGGKIVAAILPEHTPVEAPCVSCGDEHVTWVLVGKTSDSRS